MQPPHQGPPAGGGQQSIHDMQRFQQQLQVQYRQQQVLQQQQQQQFGGTNPLQQQQQHQQVPSMQQQGQHPTMNQSSALASMMQNNSSMVGMGQQQQHMSTNSNPSTSNNNMSVNGNVSAMMNGGMMAQGNPSTFNWTNQMQQQQQPQQQQQQPQQQQQQQNQQGQSTMDASRGTSDRLMAMTGMAGSTNAFNSSGSALQNMQAALLQQQRQQAAQQQQQRNSVSGLQSNFSNSQQLAAAQALQQQQQQQQNKPAQANTSGSSSSSTANMMAGLQGLQSNTSMSSQQQILFQQHLAAMQNQQQQQMGRGGGGAGALNAMAVMQNSMQQQSGSQNNSMAASQQSTVVNNLSSLQQPQGNTPQNLMQQQQQQQSRQQQQLLQQMQQQQQQMQQRAPSNTGANTGANNNNIMQQRNSGSMLQLQNSANVLGMLQQQPQMSGMGQQQQQQTYLGGNPMGGQGDINSNSNKFGTDGANTSYGQQQHQSQGIMGSNLSEMMDNRNQHVSDASKQHQSGHFGAGNGNMSNSNNNSATNSGNNLSALDSSDGKVGQLSAEQKSFLDGRFAGGWQSNADLPDRRRVIFNILEVIKQMRPDTSKLSNKLPHMAKSLEEHLYRSAKSKADYMDLTTLKKRLQEIAHGLEIHRSSDDSAPNLKQDDFLGGVQQGGAGSDATLNQNANWNVANTVRSGVQGLSGLAAQLSGSNHNMSIGGQLASSQQMQGSSGHIGNMTQQQAGITHQASSNSNISNQATASSSTFMMPSSTLPQQSSGLWAAQNQGAGNSIMSQLQQQHLQQIGQSNTGNANSSKGMQRDEPGLGNDSMGHDANSMNGSLNGSTNFPVGRTVDSFSNAQSGLHQQGSRNQSNSMTWGSVGNTAAAPQPSGSSSTSTKFQDPTSGQKSRVISQQQQRLLLLRHASKCKAGNACTTKFCEQMVVLWRHMKTCRDKDCTTSHCLSSRCVLNHYRLCKSNGRTSTCEVCGPVMMKIKQQDREDGTTEDPLTRDSDEKSRTQSNKSSNYAASSVNQHIGSSDMSQLQQVQAQKSKLKAQLDSLKLLQGQQEQLLEQQKSLEQQAQHVTDQNSPQARQLQQQQMLLQQLQKRCEQQMLLVEQELQMQTSTMSDNHGLPMQGKNSSLNQSDNVGGTKPRANQVQLRRGSGVGKGKRFAGKSLGLSSGQGDAPGRKRRGSANKTSTAKKPKAAPKPKPEKETSEPMSPMKATEAIDHTSLVSSMTKEEIQKHLDSLNKRIVLSSRTVTHKCRPIIQELLDDQFGWVFRDAVDPVALGLPDYFDVIKNPMHLDLVAKKVDNAIYSDMESFARDVRLVFQNAILYNGESSEVGELAQSMMSKFDESHKTVVQDIECSHLNLESQGELCSLCGVQKKRFEPTVLYCQGVCGMQRIKRNASYYTDRTKQNHWCESCFGLLKPNEPILLDDGCEVKKSELQILKNDALPEEGWVNCDECHSWVHQICALFNGRTNKSTARYTCPTCYVKRPKSETNLGESTKYVKGAKDLLSCKMSDAIERGMEEALKSAYAARASELGVTVDQVEKAEGLNVRVLSNVDKKQFVGEKMIKKYTHDGCPNEYPVRTKCIALFQKRHGVDTLLFALYVYEYGHECPAPNKRRVYISYLDSVQYFEPKVHRTTAYHAVLIEYLRYVKKRGFHTAHIWSCPPTPGDDYIFYCHPKHQLVPREDMLRAWYHKALDQAKAQGVVIRTTTLYDEYFTNDGADPVPGQRRNPTCLPYFEGDYIPGEIENIIENMESGKKKGGSYTSSTQHDIVMARVGHNLKKMKDNFIVVHLRNRRFAAAVERGEDVSNWKEDSDDEVVKSKRAKISGKSSVELDISSSPKLGELTSSSGPEQQSASDTVMSTQDKLIGMGAPNKSTVEAGDEAVANHAQKAEDKMNVSGDDQGTMEMNMSSTDGQQPAVTIEKASDSSISVNAESSKPSSDSDNLNEDAKQESEMRTSQISSTSVNKGAELDSKDVSVACDSASTPVPTSDDKGAGLDFNDVTVAGCSKTKLSEALSTSDGTNAELDGADAATETTVLDASPTGDDKGAELDSTNVVISTGSETKLPEASSTTYNNGSESEDVAAVGDSETKTTEVSPTSDDKGVELDSINVAAAGGSDSKIPDASSTSDDKGTESVTKDGAIGSVPDASSASGSKLASKDAGVAKSTSSNYIEPQRDTETQDGSKRQADREPKVVQQIHDNESVEVCPTSNDDTEEMVVSGAADRQSDATKQENDAPSTDEKDPKEKVANEIVAKDTPEQGTANEAGGSPERSSDVPGESNTEMDRSADKETMVKQELPTEEVVSPKDMEKTELVTATKSEEIVAGQCVSNKRVLEEMNAAVSDHFDGTVRSMSPIGDTIDEDPPLESEMFESRQQFLNYCQTTHCQFDELRRAKHSSVMVLFQLHNPMAPKFLQQCGACYRDITHGIRYHCKDCSNFDLCEDCYEPVTSGLWAKRDSRFAHDKEHSFTAIDLEAAEETQKSRAERQQSMKAHIELLEHAGTCSGPPGCALQNCMRLKKLFLHVPVCDVTPKRDCKICTRLFALATVHSRMCTMQGSCPLPFCDRIRERQRRLRKQQQLMDDRRRQAQNELYRAEEA